LFLNRPLTIIFVISVMVAFNIGHNVFHLSKPGWPLRRKAFASSGALWGGNNLIRPFTYLYNFRLCTEKTKTLSLTTTHFIILKQFVTYQILNFEYSWQHILLKHKTWR
jgi:hypothetical protein